MSSIKLAQGDVLSLLWQYTSGKKCFLRICRQDDALWVTDFPRFAQPEPCKTELRKQGYAVIADEGKKLWKIDFSPERWNRICMDSVHLPGFPREEKYTEAYALFRILFAHPAPAEENNLASARCILKTEEDEAALLKAVPALLRNAALAIRIKKPEASCAGYLLAQWLNERGLTNAD